MKQKKILVLACSLALALFVTVSSSYAASTETCKNYVEATISGAGILSGNGSIDMRYGKPDESSSREGTLAWVDGDAGPNGMYYSADNVVSISCWYHAWNNDHDPFLGASLGDNYWNMNHLETQALKNDYSFERYSTMLTMCHEDGSVKHFEAVGAWLDERDSERKLLDGYGTGSNYNYQFVGYNTGTLGGNGDEGMTVYRGKDFYSCADIMGYIQDKNSKLYRVQNAEKLTGKNGTGGSESCSSFFEGGLEGNDGNNYEETLKGTDRVVCSIYDPSKIKSGSDVVFAVSGTQIEMDDKDILITVGVSALGGGMPIDPQNIQLVDYPAKIGELGQGHSFISTSSTREYVDYPLTKIAEIKDDDMSPVSDGDLQYKKVHVRIKNSENGGVINSAIGHNPNASENYIALTICPADWKEGDEYDKCLFIDTDGVSSAFIMPELSTLNLYDSDEPEPKCTDNSGGWSWFACAATKEISEQVGNIYTYVTGFLNLDPTVFKKESGLYDAWNTARTIANGVLVILLLIIILSQISGIGIDNYGIKKMLPRIVIGVLLINLSFILFRAAVDLANIFGSAITNIFASVTKGITATPPPSDLFRDKPGRELFEGGASILVAIAGFFSIIGFLKSGQSIVVLALSAIIIVAIAVLMMFLIFILRQALIIVLSTTAPIALLFYLVPAGNATFRKWTKLVSGLLIAYPLCSLVVSGGDFAAKIIVTVMGGAKEINSGIFAGLGFNPLVYVIAIAANVAPMFFLPKMIINSTGKLGAMVQGAARRLTSRATGAFGASDFAKRMKHGAEARANRMNAGVDRQGNATAFGRLTRARSSSRRMAAEEAASKDRAERRDAQYMADHPEQALFEQNVKDEMQALEDEGVDLDANHVTDGENAVWHALENRVTDINSAEGRATIEAIARSASASRTHGNKKGPIDETIMRFMNERGASQETMAAVARARLKHAGNGMLAKSPSDYIKYQDMIAGTHVETDRGNANGTAEERAQAARYQTYQDGVMSRVIHSEGFSGGALAGYAGGEVENLANYYRRASAADQSIIRAAYDNRGIQRAGESDTDTFRELRRAIGH